VCASDNDCLVFRRLHPGAVRSQDNGPHCTAGNYNGVADILYHNIIEMVLSPMCQRRRASPIPMAKGLGVSFADYDGDGFTDIFVANDSVQCFLYHNNGNGTSAK
jgi:hypothetical protein